MNIYQILKIRRLSPVGVGGIMIPKQIPKSQKDKQTIPFSKNTSFILGRNQQKTLETGSLYFLKIIRHLRPRSLHSPTCSYRDSNYRPHPATCYENHRLTLNLMRVETRLMVGMHYSLDRSRCFYVTLLDLAGPKEPHREPG